MLVAAVIGLGLAISFAPRRRRCRSRCWSSGIGTFVLIGVAGASVIERYLAVAAVALLRVRRRRARRLHDAAPRAALRTRVDGGSAALVVFGIVFTATHVRLDYFDSELTFRGDAHDDLVRVLESPRRCRRRCAAAR